MAQKVATELKLNGDKRQFPLVKLGQSRELATKSDDGLANFVTNLNPNCGQLSQFSCSSET